MNDYIPVSLFEVEGHYESLRNLIQVGRDRRLEVMWISRVVITGFVLSSILSVLEHLASSEIIALVASKDLLEWASRRINLHIKNCNYHYYSTTRTVANTTCR